MSLTPWFKMYSESRMDPKLDALNDREFRIWHKLLCLASEQTERGTVDYIDPEYVAMNLRVGVDELDSAIGRMTRLRLLERSDTKVMFPSFAKRQYRKPSDEPEAVKERVAKHRAKKAETGNAGVTRVKRTEKRREEERRSEIAPTSPDDVSRFAADIRANLTGKKSA